MVNMEKSKSIILIITLSLFLNITNVSTNSNLESCLKKLVNIHNNHPLREGAPITVKDIQLKKSYTLMKNDKRINYIKCFTNISKISISKGACNGKYLRKLNNISYKNKIVYFSANNLKCNMKELSIISKFKNLKLISLQNSNIDNNIFFYVKNLKNLKNLYLSYNKLSNKNFILLSENKNLKRLSLNKTNINDKALRSISRLTKLKILSLKHTNITSKGGFYLEKLSDLILLDISYTNIDDYCLKNISKLTKIKDINLENTNITGKGLKYFSKLKNLKKINLNHTMIKQKYLKYLLAMKKLNVLYLHCVDLTPKDIQFIKKYHPNRKNLYLYYNHYKNCMNKSRFRK